MLFRRDTRRLQIVYVAEPNRARVLLPRWQDAWTVALIREAAMTDAVNTDPRHGKAGRQPTRAFLKKPRANADPGLFGKMFDLPAFEPSDAALKALADAMRDPTPTDSTGD